MNPNVAYLAGPMSNIPQFNFPAFDEAADVLRGQGWVIRNPAEMDSPETREAALASETGQFEGGTHNGETWGDFLSRDVKIVADEVDSVVLLEGWEFSRGAKLEVMTAILCKHPLWEYDKKTKHVKYLTHDEAWSKMGEFLHG